MDRNGKWTQDVDCHHLHRWFLFIQSERFGIPCLSPVLVVFLHIISSSSSISISIYIFPSPFLTSCRAVSPFFFFASTFYGISQYFRIQVPFCMSPSSLSISFLFSDISLPVYIRFRLNVESNSRSCRWSSHPPGKAIQRKKMPLKFHYYGDNEMDRNKGREPLTCWSHIHAVWFDISGTSRERKEGADQNIETEMEEEGHKIWTGSMAKKERNLAGGERNRKKRTDCKLVHSVCFFSFLFAAFGVFSLFFLRKVFT